MRAKHILVHIVRQHHKPIIPADEVRQFFKKALSAEELTSKLKAQLVERRKKEALKEELQALEHLLLHVRGAHADRITSIQKRIEDLKKKV
jgi:hypothetical protein